MASLAVAGASPVGAAQPLTAVQREQVAKAWGLVDLTHPRQTLVDANLQSWEVAVTRTLELDPGVAKLEASYPGVKQAAMATGRPIAAEYIKQLVDKIRETRAEMIARMLSSAEIDQAAAFVGSAPGQRLLKRMIANTDIAGESKRLATDAFGAGSARLTEQQVKQADRQAALKTAGELSVDDQVAIMRFGKTSAAQKLGQAWQEADRRTLELVNSPDPKWLSRQSEAMNEAMLRFIETARKR